MIGTSRIAVAPPSSDGALKLRSVSRPLIQKGVAPNELPQRARRGPSQPVVGTDLSVRLGRGRGDELTDEADELASDLIERGVSPESDRLFVPLRAAEATGLGYDVRRWMLRSTQSKCDLAEVVDEVGEHVLGCPAVGLGHERGRRPFTHLLDGLEQQVAFDANAIQNPLGGDVFVLIHLGFRSPWCQPPDFTMPVDDVAMLPPRW